MTIIFIIIFMLIAISVAMITMFKEAVTSYKQYTTLDAEKAAHEIIEKIEQQYMLLPIILSSQKYNIETIKKINKNRNIYSKIDILRKKIQSLDEVKFSYDEVARPLLKDTYWQKLYFRNVYNKALHYARTTVSGFLNTIHNNNIAKTNNELQDSALFSENDVVLLLHKDSYLLKIQYFRKLYDDALSHAREVETIFFNVLLKEKDVLEDELKTLNSSDDFRQISNEDLLSELLPKALKPVSLEEISNINVVLSYGTKHLQGISHQGKSLNPSSIIDIDTFALNFDAVSLYFFENVMVVDALDNLAIISYSDLPCTYTYQTINDKLETASIVYKNDSGEYRIQFECLEGTLWLWQYIKRVTQSVTPSKIQIAGGVIHDIPTATIAKSTIDKYILDSCIKSMITIEGGSFTQGYNYTIKFYPYNDHRKNLVERNEKGERTVNISTFKIGKDLISKQIWDWIMHDSLSESTNPIVNISYNEILSFISKLNERTKLGFRLPSEEEWEFAARGGIASKNYLYSGSNSLNESREIENELGVLHMSGYVWQLCSSEYTIWRDGRFDVPSYTNNSVVKRGGAIDSKEDCCFVDTRRCRFTHSNNPSAGYVSRDYIPYEPSLCCPANRDYTNCSDHDTTTGFRLAL